MSITYQTPGSLAYSASTGATSISVAYPASIITGEALILVIGMKPSAANSGSVTTPAGWALITQRIGAGGYSTTLGADTGNCNIFAFRKIALGNETGSLSVALAASDIAWAIMFRLTNTTTVWDIKGTTGEDTSAGSVSLAFDSDPGVEVNDFIIAAMCIPTDVTTPSQFSAESLSQGGITFGTVTEVGEPDSSVGNDIGGFIVRAPISAGISTGVPTLTATAGGTTTNVRGPGIFIRIREVANPAAKWTRNYIYYGGPYFVPAEDQPVSIIAYYNTTQQPAAIKFPYGQGRVALFGVHVEVDSDSGLTTTDTTKDFLKRSINWARQSNLPFLIDNTSGLAWAPSVSGFEAVLTAMGISYTEAAEAWINANSISPTSYSGLFMPGGLAVGSSLDATGISNILNFINTGGAFVGICSGAFAAAAIQVWEGTVYNALNIFHGATFGAIDAIAAWSGEALETVNIIGPELSMAPQRRRRQFMRRAF